MTEDNWSSIMNILDKLDAEGKRLKWDELGDQVAEAYNYINVCKTNEQIFMEPHQYLYRLMLRVSNYKEPCDFDQVREQIGYTKKNEPYNYFTIHNYSFRTMLWARKKNLTDEMTNGDLNIPVSKLDDKTALHFHKKAINPIDNFLEQ